MVSGPITVAKLGSKQELNSILGTEALKDGGDTSSNYDASIFEDEDGDTSSDNVDDSGKDSARRSLGGAQTQESGTVVLGAKLLGEPDKKSNGKSILSFNSAPFLFKIIWRLVLSFGAKIFSLVTPHEPLLCVNCCR